MGTRSVTIVEDGEFRLVAMYRQMDGYPTGMGADLKNFLNGKQLCNGISYGADNSMLFNGMGCLAASLVAEFKDGIGSIYLQPTDTDLEWISFVYTIYSSNSSKGEICLKVENPSDGCVLYDGVVADFDPDKVETDYYNEEE